MQITTYLEFVSAFDISGPSSFIAVAKRKLFMGGRFQVTNVTPAATSFLIELSVALTRLGWHGPGRK